MSRAPRRITDPREEDLPPVGLIHLEDPETGRLVVLDSNDPRVRATIKVSVASSQRIRIHGGSAALSAASFSASASSMRSTRRETRWTLS